MHFLEVLVINCNCNNCRNNNTFCNRILERFHCSIKEANALFEKSDQIIDTQVVEAICTAIKCLEEALELGGKGEEIENNAYRLLDKSGCGDSCNWNSCKCKELSNKAQEQFAIESACLLHVLKLLKEAQKDIEKSSCARSLGYKFRNLYHECVHCKK